MPAATLARQRVSKAVFLDRDGTLNQAVTGRTSKGLPYFRCPLKADEVVLCDGVAQGLVKLKAAGFKLVVITNQGRIQTGELTREALIEINQRLDDLLIKAGAPTIDAWYWCPHKNIFGRRTCECGKPSPGMIKQACKDINIDVKQSYMIGDDPRDMMCGKAAGVKRSYMVVSDKYTAENVSDLVFPTFGDAARAICLMESAR